MSTPPLRPKIYHIAHVDHLASILRDGCLYSDSVMSQRPDSGTVIGMTAIKQRRLHRSVGTAQGDTVGTYVPFYFCPRSVMLYLIYKANYQDLPYKGGQEPIVHLEADLMDVIAWAKSHGRPWAVSLSNAAAAYTEFRFELTQLSDIHWEAVAARDFTDEAIRESKQAEFLLHQQFPWSLVSSIGTFDEQRRQQATNLLQGQAVKPVVAVRKEWYY